MYLFFDTETTGLGDKRFPPDWEGQPHICQLGAILTDEHGFVKAEVNLLVRPDGWIIPESASAVHGITQAAAEAYGFSARSVLTIFARLAAKAQCLIAHNIAFDLDMLDYDRVRLNMAIDLPPTHSCTMEGSRDILRLPPTPRMKEYGITQFKSPNLQETHRHFFGREFEGAHDAMADVRACRDVFFAIQRRRVAA